MPHVPRLAFRRGPSPPARPAPPPEGKSQFHAFPILRTVLPKDRRKPQLPNGCSWFHDLFCRPPGGSARSILCYLLGQGSNKPCHGGFRFTRDLPVLSYNLPPECASRVRRPFIGNVFFGRSSASLWRGTFRRRDSSRGVSTGYSTLDLRPAGLSPSANGYCPWVSRVFSAKLGDLPSFPPRTTINQPAPNLFDPVFV